MKDYSLIINGNRIDCKDIPIVLDYNVKNIHEPIDNPGVYTSDSTGVYSLDFEIVGSHDVNILFKNIFEINGQVTYYPNKKNTAELRIGSQSILNGSIQLNSISQRQIGDNTETIYNVTLYGYSKSLFVDAKDDYIKDLDFSSYRHLPNHTNIVNSWTGNTGYVYPLIDYGWDFDWSTNSLLYPTDHQNIGVSNIYSTIGLGMLPFNWSFLKQAELKPAVQVKAVLNAIATTYGYSFGGSFINSTGFTSLYCPYSNENQVPVTTQLSASTLVSYPVGNSTYNATFWDVVSSQAYGQWILTTDNIVNQHNFLSQVKQHLYIHIDINYANSAYPIPNPRFYVGVQDANWFNGSTPLIDPAYITHISDTALALGHNIIDVEVDIEKNQFITAYFGSTTGSPVQVSGCSFTITTDSGFTYDPYVELGRCFPSDLKVNDFLNGLNKMFNLYWETDKDDETKILIQPYEEYYTSGISFYDWNQKVDVNSIEVDFSNDLQTNNVDLKYETADDYFNNNVIQFFSNEYGEYKVEFHENEFIEDKTLEINATPFMPSVMNGITNQTTNGSTTFVIPKYETTDDIGTINTDIGLRILYYNGLQDATANPWYWDDTQFTSYPQMSHFSNHADLTGCTDLNFKTNQLMFPAPDGWTNQNLYELHWKNYLFNLNDSNMKLLKCKVYLDVEDIYKLRLKDTIIYNEAFWRIQSLKYNVGEKIHEVELLKVLDELDYSGHPFWSHFSQPINGGVIPKGHNHNILTTDYNFLQASNTLVIGGVNHIVGFNSGISNVIVNGNNNTVNDGSRLVNIYGNSNIVTSGISNIFIIGSGITANSDNTTYINGDIIWNGVPLSNDTVWEVGSGFHSVQTIGNGNTATGKYAVAYGRNNIAAGDYSTATAFNNTTLAQNSFIAGLSNYLTSGATGSAMLAIQNYTGTSQYTLYTNDIHAIGNVTIDGNLTVGSVIDRKPVKIVTTGYTLTNLDYWVGVSASTSQEIYLPLNPLTGTCYIVSNIGGANHIIYGNGKTINNETSIILPYPDSMDLIYSSVGWFIT